MVGFVHGSQYGGTVSLMFLPARGFWIPTVEPEFGRERARESERVPRSMQDDVSFNSSVEMHAAIKCTVQCSRAGVTFRREVFRCDDFWSNREVP